MTLNDKIIADMDAAEGTALQRLLQSIFDKAIKDNNPDVNKVLDQDIQYWFDITSDMHGSDVECFLDAMRRGKTVCAAYHLTRILFSIGADNADEISNKVRERFCKNIALHARTNEVTELSNNKDINAAHLNQFREELFVDKRYSEAFDKLVSAGNWMGIVELMTEARMKHVVDQYLVHKGDLLKIDWTLMPADNVLNLNIWHIGRLIYGANFRHNDPAASEIMQMLKPGNYIAIRTFGTSLISRLNVTKMVGKLLVREDRPTEEPLKNIENLEPTPNDQSITYYTLHLSEDIGVAIIPAFEDLEGKVRPDIIESDPEWKDKVNAFVNLLKTNFPITFGKALILGEQGMVLGYDPKVEGPEGQVEEGVTQKANLRQVINTLQACVYVSPIYNKQEEEYGMIPCDLKDRIDTVFAKFDAIKEVIVNNYQKLVSVDPDGKLKEAYMIKHETVIVPSGNEPEPTDPESSSNAYNTLYDISNLSSYYKGYKSTAVVHEEIGRNITALFGYDVTKNVNFNRELYMVVQDVMEKFKDVRNDKTTVAVIGSVLQICKMLATTIVKNDDVSIKS